MGLGAAAFGIPYCTFYFRRFLGFFLFLAFGTGGVGVWIGVGWVVLKSMLVVTVLLLMDSYETGCFVSMSNIVLGWDVYDLSGLEGWAVLMYFICG